MLLCLNAGKVVLCEEPFTVNAREAEEMIALARAKNVFLMEAMWTRFLPLMIKLRELLAAGAIGEVSQFIADLGPRHVWIPKEGFSALNWAEERYSEKAFIFCRWRR